MKFTNFFVYSTLVLSLLLNLSISLRTNQNTPILTNKETSTQQPLLKPTPEVTKKASEVKEKKVEPSKPVEKVESPKRVKQELKDGPIREVSTPMEIQVGGIHRKDATKVEKKVNNEVVKPIENKKEDVNISLL